MVFRGEVLRRRSSAEAAVVFWGRGLRAGGGRTEVLEMRVVDSVEELEEELEGEEGVILEWVRTGKSSLRT